MDMSPRDKEDSFDLSFKPPLKAFKQTNKIMQNKDILLRFLFLTLVLS